VTMTKKLTAPVKKLTTPNGQISKERALKLAKDPAFWDAFEDVIASGASFRNAAGVGGISKSTLHRIDTGSPDARDCYARARAARAEAYADWAQEAAQKAEDGQIEPHAARVVLDFAKWRAKADNPEVYAEKVDQRIRAQIDVGGDHLAALRERMQQPKPVD